MKCIWEEKDLIMGQIVSRGDGPNTTKKILGWYDMGTKEEKKDDRRYTMTSLEDGMVHKMYTKKELSEALTKGGYLPIEWYDRYSVYHN